MPRKKSKLIQEQPKSSKVSRSKQIGFWGATSAVFVLVLDFVGRVVTGLDFLQYLFEWRTHILNFIVLSGLVAFLALGIAIWQLFRQKNSYRYIYSATILVIAVTSLSGWITYVRSREYKLIVLIAKFDDTKGDFYQLRDEIYDELSQDFEKDNGVQIERVNEIITNDQGSGSPRARVLGRNYQADIVIWGTYRESQNPNMKLHIENLSPDQLLTIKESEKLKPAATLAELQSFTFQQQIGAETSALISSLAGYIDYRNGDYKSAVAHFDQALAQIPDTPRLFENKAGIYFYRASANLFLQGYQDAIQGFDQFIQNNPQYADAYANRGLAYAYLQDYDQALQDFNKAIELNPNDTAALGNRGNTYSELGKHQLAIQDFGRVITLDPNDARAYSNRGRAYTNLQDYSRALKDIEKAIDLSPNYALAYFNLGIAHLRLEDYDHAIKDFDKVVDLTPNSSDAYYNRGLSYYYLKNYDRAIQDFDIASGLAPNDADIYYYRGLVYAYQKDEEHAIWNYDKAIQIDPSDPLVYYNRGLTYADLKDYERAIEDFNRAIELGLNFTETYYCRGLAYYYLGDFDNAIQDYDKAIELDSSYAPAYKNRGLMYQKLGRTSEAEADLSKFYDLTGQNPP
jgi:tetratricopeptide (TPR) repeat protein